MRGVFTDTENNKLLEITEDNLKRTVKKTIQSMENYEDIEVVTIDMWSGYRYACKELIPNATIVVDKFHVVQYANIALDKVRKDAGLKFEDKNLKTAYNKYMQNLKQQATTNSNQNNE